MLYVSLDDWTEEIPFDEYEDTSDWLIEVEKLPEADWLKEALLLNVYWSDSPEFRDIVDKCFGIVAFPLNTNKFELTKNISSTEYYQS